MIFEIIPIETSGLTYALICMVFIVLLYTTGKLLTSPVPVSISTVVLEYAPLCLWSVVIYRMLEYDKIMYHGYVPEYHTEWTTDDVFYPQ